MTDQLQETPEADGRPPASGLIDLLKLSGGFREIVGSAIFLVSLTISMGMAVFMWSSGIDPYGILIEVKAQCLNFLPDILGFAIAGIALMVGFSDFKVISLIIGDEPEENLYERLISKFGLNIIVQAVTLLFAYLVHFINELHMASDSWLSGGWAVFFNWTGLILLTLLFILSLVVIIQIVLDIFNFSQVYQIIIQEEKKK